MGPCCAGRPGKGALIGGLSSHATALTTHGGSQETQQHCNTMCGYKGVRSLYLSAAPSGAASRACQTQHAGGWWRSAAAASPPQEVKQVGAHELHLLVLHTGARVLKVVVDDQHLCLCVCRACGQVAGTVKQCKGWHLVCMGRHLLGLSTGLQQAPALSEVACSPCSCRLKVPSPTLGTTESRLSWRAELSAGSTAN